MSFLLASLTFKLKNFFQYYSENLVDTDYLRFYLLGNTFALPLFVKTIFDGYGNVNRQGFFLSHSTNISPLIKINKNSTPLIFEVHNAALLTIVLCCTVCPSHKSNKRTKGQTKPPPKTCTEGHSGNDGRVYALFVLVVSWVCSQVQTQHVYIRSVQFFLYHLYLNKATKKKNALEDRSGK